MVSSQIIVTAIIAASEVSAEFQHETPVIQILFAEPLGSFRGRCKLGAAQTHKSCSSTGCGLGTNYQARRT